MQKVLLSIDGNLAMQIVSTKKLGEEIDTHEIRTIWKLIFK